MTCIGCGHLFIDGETARCALRIEAPRSMREYLTACDKHTEAHPTPSEPMPAVIVPTAVMAIIARTAQAYGVAIDAVRSPVRQGTVNQHVRHHGTTEAMQRLTVTAARQAAILLVLDAGYTPNEIRGFFGLASRCSIDAARHAEPIIRQDSRVASYFTTPLTSKEGCR